MLIKKMHIQMADQNTLFNIVEILNKVTLNLHDKGIAQWDYPWKTTNIASDISNGYVYLVHLDELPVGTFSIKATKPIDLPVMKPENLYLYRIAVLPEFQGQKLGKQITKYACEHAQKLNKALYLDCWAGNQKLIDFYTKAGLKSLGVFPEDDYFINIFMYL